MAILLAVVRRVLAHDRVGLPTILGAISAYVLIGMVFAWIYLAMYGIVDGPLLDPDEAGLPTYYSFVVLTTLGFGDITPVEDLVQRLTALEAMIGQIFLATLVARLVSLYGSPTRGANEASIRDRPMAGPRGDRRGLQRHIHVMARGPHAATRRWARLLSALHDRPVLRADRGARRAALRPGRHRRAICRTCGCPKLGRAH